MNTELGNIGGDHAAKSVNSLAPAASETGPTADVLPLASEHATIAVKTNGSSKHSEGDDAQSSVAPQQQEEARAEKIARKESLADWGVVACVFLNNLISALDFTGFGVYYPFLVQHFEATTAAVGWCSSISGFVQAVTALFASYPIQSFGCRLPAVVGCLLFSLGVSLSSLAPTLPTIYFTYGVISGSGKGIATLSSSIIIHQRFSRNRNLASGIGWVGASIGGIIGPFLANHLIQSYGWRGAFLITGAIQAQRIPFCLFFRTPKRLTSRRSDHRANGAASSPRISGHAILNYLKEALNFSICRQARYAMYVVAYILHMFCLIGYAQHTVNRAIQVGLSRDQGVAAASLFSILSLVTRLIISFISNVPKVKSSLVFAVGMLFAFLSIVALYVNPGIIGTMTSTALYGVHMGCTTTVFTIVAVDLMGVALLPKSLSILAFTGGFARLVSPPFIGWVFDVTRDYNKAFAIIGVMAFVSGSIMVALTIVTSCRQNSVTEDIEFSPSGERPKIHPRDQKANSNTQ